MNIVLGDNDAYAQCTLITEKLALLHIYTQKWLNFLHCHPSNMYKYELTRCIWDQSQAAPGLSRDQQSEGCKDEVHDAENHAPRAGCCLHHSLHGDRRADNMRQ